MIQANSIAETPTAAGPRTTDIGRCRVRIVSTDTEFDLLEGQWNSLLAESAGTIFQTYEWQRTWWKYFGTPEDRLHILVFEISGDAVGIAPMILRQKGFLVHLEFIAHGLSDYIDFIIRPGFEEAVFRAFARHLQETAKSWDVLDMEEVNETTSLIRLLPNILKSYGITSYQYQGNVCPIISLPASSEDFMQNSGGGGANFKRKFKRLQQKHKAEIEVFQHETDEIERAIETFSSIHGGRWESLGHPSAFSDGRFREFHVEFSRKFARRGWLRMLFLIVDDIPLAVAYNFNYGKRIYMYNSNAHADEEVMRCSPGFLIRSISMVQGIYEGMSVFDFLRGDEPYKYREWHAVDSKNYLLRLGSPHRRWRFAAFLVLEFIEKAADRAKRERYDYRRFRISRPGQHLAAWGYFAGRIFNLIVVAVNFLLRHSPVHGLRKIQLGQRSTHEDVFTEKPGKENFLQRTGRLIESLKSEFRINRLRDRVRSFVHKPTIVADIDSPMSGRIQVIDCGRERRLVIKGETHSLAFTSGNWGEAGREYWGGFLLTPYAPKTKAEILLLGLGGGTVLRLIHEKISPEKITVLERDPRVVEVAKKYFGLEKLPGVSILVGDAKQSLKKLSATGKKFDWIIDDIYSEPNQLTRDQETALIRQYTGLLNSGGSISLHRNVGVSNGSAEFLETLKNMNLSVEERRIRQRWWHDVIYCRPRV